MCLGIPGQIIAVTDAARMMAMAEVSGVRRAVNVACIAQGPLDDLVGQWRRATRHWRGRYEIRR